MASFVKKGDKVLEPGCGPAILADFLPKTVSYSGFDTNENFVKYAISKKRNVFYGNALNAENYSLSDVVVACDILHHLKPADRKKFIKLCFRSAKKSFIICDPGGKEYSNTFFSRIKKRLDEWSEQDGTSDFKAHYHLTDTQLLKEIDHGFDAIPRTVKRDVKRFGEDLIAIFFK